LPLWRAKVNLLTLVASKSFRSHQYLEKSEGLDMHDRKALLVAGVLTPSLEDIPRDLNEIQHDRKEILRDKGEFRQGVQEPKTTAASCGRIVANFVRTSTTL
jgi:hypothetical protein